MQINRSTIYKMKFLDTVIRRLTTFPAVNWIIYGNLTAEQTKKKTGRNSFIELLFIVNNKIMLT